MRAWVMSDLHVDSTMYRLPSTPPDVDVLVIAGDVDDGHERSCAWLADHAVSTGLPILYILDNQDYYGHDLHERCEQLYGKAGVILVHARRPTTEIAGTRFIGLTLWTDYQIAGDEASARSWARQNMPDMLSIDVGMRRVNTRDLLEQHQYQRAILETELGRTYFGSTVVVTHHAPHKRSPRSVVQMDPSDGSFASDMTSVMERLEPAVWVHGHTHLSRDYYDEATRIVCNPRGPVLTTKAGRRIENSNFMEQLVLDI